ncbi:serine/threonine-protein kinase [Conexibacter sp. CPCC 206217]|uniref:serine/threonine-protein kinase n=1 Tax=Conexibacter sp. CPCC 206217 TaxID=3064574 RepID=UPI0027267110|nr:serine/threonine-protein kinase [Conexibacter sp. CPCC 206217]MDO8210259.1 serine/threonine-protein kinase [Conexibacter sp. CPCC 206217]
MTLLHSQYAGRYTLEELLGQGAHAVVYRAWDAVRAMEVALKLYNEDALDHQTAEAATNAKVADCAAVMPLFEVFTDVLPREATSMPLAKPFVKRFESLSCAEVRLAGLRLFTALAFCHGRGVVHGDIKPANLFRDRHGHLQLGDFGVADFLPGARRGHTLEYAAPELLAGEPRSPQTDVWAASVTLFELMCGELPFGSTLDSSEAEVAERISSGQAQKVADLRPFLPRRLQSYFRSAFKVDPAQREITSAIVAHNAISEVAALADWVRIGGSGAIERWEGVERDRDGNPTGVQLAAELVFRPNLRRYEAHIYRQRPGGQLRRIPGARGCQGPSEATVRQLMYARMRALTEGRSLR